MKSHKTGRIFSFLDQLVTRYSALDTCKAAVGEAYEVLERTYSSGGKLLIVGNGGSAADSEHIVGELMKGFALKRHLSDEEQNALLEVDSEMGKTLSGCLQGALPAIALDGHPALNTAYINDCDPLLCFAQQVHGYGKRGDALLAISTSGVSKNVLYAAVTARAKGISVVGLTGARLSRLSDLSDVCIRVPATDTYMVQELHLPIYHCLCLMLEERFFGGEQRI